jgi:uncharacterized repeat protein (TIGR01451 family)
MKFKSCAAALAGAALLAGGPMSMTSHAQNVTFRPYIQPGDAGAFGPKDQMVIAWQTDEPAPGSLYTVEFGATTAYGSTAPNHGRTVDNYLSADPVFSAITLPFAYGAHTDYYALLSGLEYDTTYYYRVKGPGLPVGGYKASFSTRKRGTRFSFEVQGDEGYYPGVPNSNPARIANYEARIIHTMYHVQDLALPGQPTLPVPDFALNTGDNVYITGCDSNYRDVWFEDWNSDTDTSDYGAPFLSHIPLYIVDGNHDVGSTGATANLLADSGDTVPGAFGPGPFGGGVGGGDAMAHFNNFYFPLNGPVNTDIQYHFTGDTSTPTNFLFSYNGVNYTSPAAIEALRASTTVDTGTGRKRQIDHESNYSFDQGSAHFLFLDANPHLFDNLLPGGPPGNAPAFPFPHYPSVLRKWVIHDLDGSQQTWKIAVFHQPAFSSGNATISNDQMRRIAGLLEDHGVNIVFNGHEHNYQRSLPIRALPGADAAPTKSGPPVVAVDTAYDGVENTVPDGVLYIVEGTGGNRDFDDNLPNPRGGGLGIDQDDAAAGTFQTMVNGQRFDFVNGPASWLDTHLTDNAMTPYIPGAGTGPRITARFKSKVFGFADVMVDDNTLTLYQISEPLSDTSSGTPANPAPYGTDVSGKPLNDPIPDTLIDPATGVVQSAGEGTPALLDKFIVTRPNVGGKVAANLSAPPAAAPGGALVYTVTASNRGTIALNGTQVVVTLPPGVSFAGSQSDTLTVQGQDVVVTLGRLAPGARRFVQVKARVPATAAPGTLLNGAALLRSSTALPLATNTAATKVVKVPPFSF